MNLQNDAAPPRTLAVFPPKANFLPMSIERLSMSMLIGATAALIATGSVFSLYV
jgi:hypothetical protein